MTEVAEIIQKLLEQNQQLQTQHAATLKEIADRLSTAPDSNLEQRMDSLANNMQVFRYDPEAGQTFEIWYRRYEEIFQEDAKFLNDAAKIRLCLRKLDAPAHDKFKDALLPKAPKDFSFDEIIKKLKNTFGRQESIFNVRYKCLQTVKSENTDFVTYATQVNRQCEDFQLKDLSDDQFKCLIFVSGLSSPHDAELRMRLLAKLEQDQKSEQSLEKLISETQRLMSLKRDTTLIESNVKTQPAVRVIKHSAKRPTAIEKPRTDRPHSNQNRPNARVKSPMNPAKPNTETKPPRPCWLCGGIHFVRNCTFASHRCNECKEIGHKDGYCNYSRTSKTKGRLKQPPKAYLLRVNEIHNEHNLGDFASKRKFITVKINQTIVNLQIDTASDLTIISKETWTTLGAPGTKLGPTAVKSASTDVVPIIAEFECEMGIPHTGQVSSGKCVVTSIKGLNVLGIDWIERFGLWDRPINGICNTVQKSVTKRNSITTDLQREFPKVFSDTPGHCSIVKASVHLKPNVRPVFRPKRPVSFAALEAVEKELKRLQDLNIIKPVEFSEWAAPIVVVRRPNGRIRICADYSTGLNSCVEVNAYPLPTPENMFTQLAGSKVFSRIDLSDAYLQVEVDDESKRLMTINTHKGLFNFNRLAPGIKSAPGSFQQIIDTVLSGLDGVLAYFDDILVHSKDEVSHKTALKCLFERLDKYGLRVKAEKCDLMTDQIKYLGIVINAEGITSDPSKIAAISALPIPQDVQQLRSFLGAITFYAKFVRQMHELRAPLDRLLKKDVEWKWSEECQNSFDKFKQMLSSELLLTHYNPAYPVKVYADASNMGIGASISHVFPDGREKMISHVSRTLTKPEKNYSQIEKEGLALVYAVKKFHRYLFGRNFTLVTDHKPLLSIFGSKNGIPVYSANRLQRWALILTTYDFNIQYTSSTEIGTADMLSRLIDTSRVNDEDYIIARLQFEDELNEQIEETIGTLPVSREMIEKATRSDKTLRSVARYIRTDWPDVKQQAQEDSEVYQFYSRRRSLSIINDCIMFGERIVIPKQYRKRILRILHKAHVGTEAMKMLARAYVFWPKIDEDITNIVRSCNSCAENAKLPVRTLLQSWPRSTRPMERVHTDIAGPINGKWYIISVDSYSMFPEVHECNNITSATCSEKLNEFFAHHGNPETLVTDNGTQFTSAIFKDFCESRGIDHITTPPFHPMSNGRAERFVDSMKRALKKAEGEGKSKEILLKYLHVYRSTPNRNAEGMKSPAELFLGRPIRTELDLVKASPQRSSERNLFQEQQYNRHHGARLREFGVGDKVYARVYRRNEPYWEKGIIRKRIGKVIYLVELLSRRRTIRSSANQLRLRYTSNHVNIERVIPHDILIPSTIETYSESSEAIGTSQDHQASSPTAVADPSPSSVCSRQRPLRMRRPPTYLEDYVIN